MKKQPRSLKNAKNLLKVRIKESSIWHIYKDLLFEKSKESEKFKEMYKKNGVSKTSKSIRKVSKTHE